MFEAAGNFISQIIGSLSNIILYFNPVALIEQDPSKDLQTLKWDSHVNGKCILRQIRTCIIHILIWLFINLKMEHLSISMTSSLTPFLFLLKFKDTYVYHRDLDHSMASCTQSKSCIIKWRRWCDNNFLFTRNEY